MHACNVASIHGLEYIEVLYVFCGMLCLTTVGPNCGLLKVLLKQKSILCPENQNREYIG